jgi:phosphohistidine swiveling domain-containing protein
MNCDNIPFIVNLEEKHATDLDIVGGKGANLAILSQRGFCVPDAFIITTSAFQYVLNDNQTKAALLIIDELNVDNINELENVSSDIKRTICNITLPDDIINLIIKNHDKLCEKNTNMNIHVAVRSSATAEDLPDNSFAGQQDTYLHVTKENLIEKIKECWASLFTARAISYRKKSNIDHKLVKLAVVIQVMICSEASGVAFTANPITGLRNEVIIDSTYGLGEALVSGLVTPDHYEILFDNKQNPEIRIKTIGEKSIRIIGKSDGGTETLITENNDKQLEALADEYIIQLAKLAKQVEKSYNYQPQDLEWSFIKGKLYILQARPITTLFPIPKHAYGQSDLRLMVSFGAMQGFLEPMTPLGQSTVRTLLCSLLRTVGVNRTASFEDDISSNPERHNIFKASASRMWIDITGILTSPVRYIFGLSLIDTGMSKIINHLNTPKYFPSKSIFSSLKTCSVLLLFFIPFIFKTIRNFVFPRYAKRLYFKQIEKYHQFVDQGFDTHTFTDCVQHFQNILTKLPLTLSNYGAPCLLPGVISLKILQKIAHNPVEALALTRAVESNPTTEMNLILWKLTVLIKENDTVLKLFQSESTENLVNMYRKKLFNENIQTEMNEFFRIYGCRGIGEIDLGRKRWSDEPERVIEQIKNYLKIQNPDKSISKIHEQSQQTAYEIFNQIDQHLKYPIIQRPLINILFNRLKILFSVRESPKFHGLIQTFGKCRKELFRKAELAVKENFISQVDDICFLYIGELQALAFDTDHKQSDKINYWKDLISQRRMEYNKQMLCKRIPLILLSNGTTYYDATTIPNENNDQMELMEGEFLGCPVSPGVYEGKVRIVDDPMNSGLEPGEILVCTATDPAWTSLFPIVGGLVLEMGGMLQHGAIVSREYGLPAVVGVANAKKIFHNGQLIQVNGSNGRIKILSD